MFPLANIHDHPSQADDSLHDRLLVPAGEGDPFDRHVLASAIRRVLLHRLIESRG